MQPSAVSATGTAWERTPWHATQRAASVLDSDVPIFYIAKLSQPLAEGVLESRSSRGRVSGEITFPGHFQGLLRLRRDRRSEDAPAHHGDERSPVHQSLLIG